MNAVVAQHLQQAGAKTAADAGAPFVTPAEAEERSFVQALPADEARAHMTLASLRRSFDETGWSQPLAVAVVRQGETEAVFYATADGLSVWPTGVSLPENVFPLGYLRPVSEDAAWLGYADPSEKLGGLPGTQLILTTEAVALTPDAENSHPVQTQTPSQYREIARCRDTLPAHTTRGADLRDGDVDALLARVLAAHPAVSSPEDAATALRQARWYDRQPAGYVAAYMDYLVSEAVAARDAGDTGGAVYLASQAAELLNLPSGEEVP